MGVWSNHSKNALLADFMLWTGLFPLSTVIKLLCNFFQLPVKTVKEPCLKVSHYLKSALLFIFRGPTVLLSFNIPTKM